MLDAYSKVPIRAADTPWQPDGRTNLVLAGFLTLLAAVGFASLLRQPRFFDVSPAHMTISLQPFPPAAARKLPSRVTLRPGRAALVAPRPVPVTAAVPAPTPWLQAMDAAVQADTSGQEGKGTFSSETQTASGDLRRALQASPAPQVTQQGEAYHSAYGMTVLKSHGMCGESQMVRTGPAPQDQVLVTSPIACPGEYKPSMGEELLTWAKKVEQRLPKPPR